MYDLTSYVSICDPFWLKTFLELFGRGHSLIEISLSIYIWSLVYKLRATKISLSGYTQYSCSLINQQIFINHGISLSLVPSEQFRTALYSYFTSLDFIVLTVIPMEPELFSLAAHWQIYNQGFWNPKEKIKYICLMSLPVKFHLFFSLTKNKNKRNSHKPLSTQSKWRT